MFLMFLQSIFQVNEAAFYVVNYAFDIYFIVEVSAYIRATCMLYTVYRVITLKEIDAFSHLKYSC